MTRRMLLGLALALAGAVAPAAASAQTPSLTLLPFDQLSPNPTGLKMYYYVPPGGAATKPIVVVLHGCQCSVPTCGTWARFLQLAAARDFIVIQPDTNRQGECWDVASVESLQHVTNLADGSDPAGIVSMVDYAVANLGGDGSRVFAVGQSSGAMMSNVLAGDFPDRFVAIAPYMGVPFGCFGNPATHRPAAGTATTEGPATDGSTAGAAQPYWSNACAQGQASMDLGAQAWGDKVRAAYPGYTGARPRMQFWHGTADTTLFYANFGWEIEQWTNVLYGATAPNTSIDKPMGSIIIPDKPTNYSVNWTRVFTRTRYSDAADFGPQAALESISVSEMGHASSQAPIEDEIVRFFGLGGDTTAPSAPGKPVITAGSVYAGGVMLTWPAATDAVGVLNYVVYQHDGGTVTPVAWPGASDGFTGSPNATKLTPKTPGATYTYSVAAVDAAGNISAPSPESDPVTFPQDTTGPLVTFKVAQTVTTPKTDIISATGVTLSLSADDEVGVASYVISVQNGGSWTQVTSGSSLTQTLKYAISGLTPSTTYAYRADVADPAGNHTIVPLTVTTLAGAGGGGGGGGGGSSSGGGGGGCGQGPAGASSLLLALAAAALLWKRREPRPQ